MFQRLLSLWRAEARLLPASRGALRIDNLYSSMIDAEIKILFHG